jgi:hypothetical protein
LRAKSSSFWKFSRESIWIVVVSSVATSRRILCASDSSWYSSDGEPLLARR